MARKRRAAGKLPLDDPRWMPIVEAHTRLCQRTGDPQLAQLAARELTDAMARERDGLRSMRRSIYDADPDGERLTPSYWAKNQLWSRLEWTMAGATGDALIVRRRDGRDPKGPDGAIGPSYSYVYFVWRPDLKKVGLKPSVSEDKPAVDAPPHRKPGRRPKKDWPTHVARELIRRARASEPEPTAPEMLQFLEDTIGWQPDVRQMQRLLQELLS